MPNTEQIPGVLTTARSKEKINQACASNYLPLLTFHQKSWRNILHRPSPQAKGQKLVVHGPNHLCVCARMCVHVCAPVCMCVFIYAYRDRKML